MSFIPPPKKTDITFQVFKIGCLVLGGLFLMSMLGYYLVCNFLMKKSNEYESMLTSLRGVFEVKDSVRAPLSGKMTSVVVFDVNSTRWSLGSDRSEIRDYFYVFYYKPGTVFKANGKKYTIMGQRPHRFAGEKRIFTRLTTTCGYKNQDPIPNTLDGIDTKLDNYITRLRAGDCGFGTTYNRFNLVEYCYTSVDTVTIRSFVRNDTIFLATSKY